MSSSNNNSQRVARQHMSQQQQQQQLQYPNPLSGGHFSSRVVVVGPENCTSVVLGGQVTDSQISVSGRTRTWTEAGQALGCGDVVINERHINCPTSKRNMKPASNATGSNNDNNNNNNTNNTSNNLHDGRFPTGKNMRTNLKEEKNTSLANDDQAADITSPTKQQPLASAVAQLIHAKSTTVSNIIPSLTLEFFEINETDVATLANDQLFGPYVLAATTAAAILVVDCAQLFPAPPSCSLLIESVDAVIQQVERKKREAAQREAMLFASATFVSVTNFGASEANPSSSPPPTTSGAGNAEADIPTLSQVLDTYRSRQDAAAEQYIQATAERIQTLRTSLDTWAGEGANAIPIHVAIHNTETVAPRLEAWSVTNAWAKLSDASRAKVLSKIPTKGQSQEAGVKQIQVPSLQSCCAPEPFVQAHLSLHKTYPLVSVTLRAIRGVLSQIGNRVNGTLFFPSLTSALDQTPIALLSSVIARPQVIPNTSHLQEIVHSFKNRCFFRRVFVIEPRTLIVVACDRPFQKYVTGIPRSQGEKETAAALLAQHPSPLGRAPGVEPSFSNAQSFVQDYLNVADALKLSTSLSMIVTDDFNSEATLAKASYNKEEQGEILMNVAEGGFAAWRGSLELTNGEGVFLYGLAPPVGLILGCIGDCVEVQRMQSLIEFNLHIVQETVGGLFEETMKRARAAGYAA